MKIALLALGLGLVLNMVSIAHAADVPTICGPTCSKEQWAMWDEFKQGIGVDPAKLPAVYSGECYHSGFGYDGKDIHYAVAAFDSYQGGFVYGGVFSFFVPSNPYAHLTLEQARAQGM